MFVRGAVATRRPTRDLRWDCTIPDKEIRDMWHQAVLSFSPERGFLLDFHTCANPWHGGKWKRFATYEPDVDAQMVALKNDILGPASVLWKLAHRDQYRVTGLEMK